MILTQTIIGGARSVSYFEDFCNAQMKAQHKPSKHADNHYVFLIHIGNIRIRDKRGRKTMKSNSDRIIIEYDNARINVRGIEKRLKSMECEHTPKSGREETVDFVPCLVRAYDEYTEDYESGHTYEEILENGEDYCDTCKEKFRIKRDEYAKAKKIFGNSKRSIATYARRLKGQKHEQ